MTEQPLSRHDQPRAAPEQTLPYANLAALAAVSFVALLTEIMPAGLLSAIARGLSVSEGAAGQFITAFALGAFLCAIPLTALTERISRKLLLVLAVSGFALINAATAISSNFTLLLALRFMAGALGGLIWSMLAGYAVRISPLSMRGRAIAIAGSGATAALVAGVPLSALLGRTVGWRGAFVAISVIAAALVAWIILLIEDVSAENYRARKPLKDVIKLPGVLANLALVLSFIAAHNVVYVYIEPAIESLGGRVDVFLLVFGAGAVAGLVTVGMLADRCLPVLPPIKVVCVAAAVLILQNFGDASWVAFGSALVWGAAFGGFSAMTQSAFARLSGSALDVTQAMSTTTWSAAISLGGLLGAMWLGRYGTATLSSAATIVLFPALIAAIILSLTLSRTSR